jgi:hypothetical protein
LVILDKVGSLRQPFHGEDGPKADVASTISALRMLVSLSN